MFENAGAVILCSMPSCNSFFDNIHGTYHTIQQDDQFRLVDVKTTYSKVLQNKSIQSFWLLEPIIGDDLPPILSKFQDILRCYRKEEQKIDLKLTHNDPNPELRSNEQQYNTAFTSDSGPMFNRVVENITSFGCKSDISNIKTQSSEAFRIPELEQNKGPAERLTSMLRHHIKESFRDETDTAYVVIGDKHRQLICFDHDSFDEWAANLYEQCWNEVPSTSMIKNVKRVIRYSIKEQRSLHNRVAFTGDIWYDLHRKAVKVTSENVVHRSNGYLRMKRIEEFRYIPITYHCSITYHMYHLKQWTNFVCG